MAISSEEEARRRCPECDETFDDDYQFCPNDGTELVSEDELIPTCTECGKKYDEDWLGKHCPDDGGKILAKSQHGTESESPQSMQWSQKDTPASEMDDSKIKPTESKSPGLAALLSLLFVGAGQLYLGQVGKGVSIFFGGVFITILTSGVAGIPILIMAAIDAYQIGSKLNSGRAVGYWEWF